MALAGFLRGRKRKGSPEEGEGEHADEELEDPQAQADTEEQAPGESGEDPGDGTGEIEVEDSEDPEEPGAGRRGLIGRFLGRKPRNVEPDPEEGFGETEEEVSVSSVEEEIPVEDELGETALRKLEEIQPDLASGDRVVPEEPVHEEPVHEEPVEPVQTEPVHEEPVEPEYREPEELVHEEPVEPEYREPEDPEPEEPVKRGLFRRKPKPELEEPDGEETRSEESDSDEPEKPVKRRLFGRKPRPEPQVNWPDGEETPSEESEEPEDPDSGEGKPPKKGILARFSGRDRKKKPDSAGSGGSLLSGKFSAGRLEGLFVRVLRSRINEEGEEEPSWLVHRSRWNFLSQLFRKSLGIPSLVWRPGQEPSLLQIGGNTFAVGLLWALDAKTLKETARESRRILVSGEKSFKEALKSPEGISIGPGDMDDMICFSGVGNESFQFGHGSSGRGHRPMLRSLGACMAAFLQDVLVNVSSTTAYKPKGVVAAFEVTISSVVTIEDPDVAVALVGDVVSGSALEEYEELRTAYYLIVLNKDGSILSGTDICKIDSVKAKEWFLERIRTFPDGYFVAPESWGVANTRAGSGSGGMCRFHPCRRPVPASAYSQPAENPELSTGTGFAVWLSGVCRFHDS